jgi:hypothetical protein
MNILVIFYFLVIVPVLFSFDAITDKECVANEFKVMVVMTSIIGAEAALSWVFYTVLF